MKYFVLIGLVLTVILVSGCTQNNAKIAAVPGWLFEVQTDQGVEKYLVMFEEHALPSAPKILFRVFNEDQLIELTRTGEWVEPFEKHTLEEWESQCDQQDDLLKHCKPADFDSECSENSNQKNCQSYDYWLLQCISYNERFSTCQGLPYEMYESLMLSYMQQNDIDGEIVNKYVGYFMIAGSGVDFPDETQ